MPHPHSQSQEMTSEERLSRFKFKTLTSDLPQDRIRLPIGLIHDGVLLTHAVVRAMTGKDRKDCADAKYQRSSSHMTTALLRQCLLSLSDESGKTVIDDPNVSLVRKMSEPDRSFLSLEIRRRTYPGQKLLVVSDCDNPSCKVKLEFEVDLEEDIDVIRVEPLWRGERPCFEVHEEQYGFHAIMHYLSGEDTERLSERFGNVPERQINPVELIQATTLAMISEINGVNDVTMKDLEAFPQEYNSILEDAIMEHRAGPDLTPLANCKECGHETTLQVGIVDFLLRGRQKKG